MKKRSVKKEKAAKQIFNKLGMTYVELICALALLSLIVMMFTPMLLSSYETLYSAGERVEKVYDSKEEIETGLATRFKDTNITISNVGFKNNTKSLFATMNVKLKKVVSTIHEDFETAFGTGRASVDIISPSIVYDDQDNHDVVIQTAGIEYSKVMFGRFTYTDEQFIQKYNELVGAEDSEETGLIFIEVCIPDKNSGGSTTDFVAETSVYGDILAKIKMNGAEVSNDTYYSLSNISNEGRIEFNISGSDERLDFTQSPVRICVYYINTRNKVRSTSDYLIIEPPSMIFAGDGDKANKIDYYTSAGVEKDETVISNLGSTSTIQGTYNFENQARNMNVSNSGALTANDIPSATGSRIQTITWVDSDENSYLRPYYVMAGTNSSVYRMYNYNSMTDMPTVFGNLTGLQTGVTTYNPTDGSTILSDGTQAHPSFWSGEISDQYSFQTMYKSATYGAADDNEIDCSAPQTNNDVAGSTDLIGTRYNIFDNKLRYSMMFCSFSTGYTYASQMNRKISYTLTEAGNKSFRIAGKKYEEGDFIGYHTPWEQWVNSSGNVVEDYYKYSGSVFSANTDDERALYFGGKGALAAENKQTDMHLSYIRLSSYTNVNPLELKSKDATTYNRFVNSGDFWSPYGESEESLKDTTDFRNYTNYINTDYSCNVNITSSVFIPGAGSEGQGQVIYFGTVPSYGLVQQRSDVIKGNTKMYNTKTVLDYPSLVTAYLICGSQGEGTTLYRNAASSYTNTVDTHNIMRADIETGSGEITTLTDQTTFYTKGNDDVTYKYYADDLEFTFGYCSRWRMAVGDVTFNGSKEETKSYEKYYTATSTSETYTRKPGINQGTENNVYYNVWFPGEYYNLTQTATCDEVTIACGYAVSGSTFMEQSSKISGYYGTALGSVYNDGVLAVYSEQGTKFTTGLSGKGEQNVIFENCLYYKSPSFTDSTLHSRESIRFTEVGLFALTDLATQKKDYYAVYGDNHGRAYYSKIATSDVELGEPKKDANGNIMYDASGEVILETKESGVTLRSGSNSLQTAEAKPIKINNQTLDQYFSEITTIEAEEGFVVISGIPNETTKKEIIVIVEFDSSGNPTAYSIENKDAGENNFTGTINQAMILGGYYYFLGGDSNGPAGKKGWIAAVEVETLKSMKQGDHLTTYEKTATFTRTVTEANGSVTTTMDKYPAVFCYTETALYALGGRLTNS